MFGVTVITFLIATADIAARIATFAILIRDPLVDNIRMSVADGLQLSTVETVVPQIILEWTTTLLVCGYCLFPCYVRD